MGAFVLAGLAMLVSFKVLPTAQAEAIGVFVTAFLALLRPSRECTPAGSPTSSPDSHENA